MRELNVDGKLLAKHIAKADFKAGLNFFSQDNEFIQVGVWQYTDGKELPAHVHNVVERTINRTYETLYIIEGKIEATLYTLDGEQRAVWLINKGDILILLEGGHGYKILEDNTTVLEVKNGPYVGAELDRRRI